jgi:hypothetical protein
MYCTLSKDTWSVFFPSNLISFFFGPFNTGVRTEPPNAENEGVSRSFRTESITINNNKHSLKTKQRIMAAKLTRTTHKISIQLHLVAELYHLHFSLQAASPETFGYTFVCSNSERVQG